MPDFPDLPEATVARLPEYLRALHHLAEDGHETVSSDALATAAGVNSAKLRKDLSHLGSYGTRGVGYDVDVLVDQIESVLGLTQRRAVVLVGVGNLGHALAGYGGFASRGFRIAALLDADHARVGERINGLVVHHIGDLDSIVADQHITIAVIATPADAAQAVADRLVAAGVTSILNFAPCVLTVPDGVDVRKVDLAIELQILSFHQRRKAAAGSDGDRTASTFASPDGRHSGGNHACKEYGAGADTRDHATVNGSSHIPTAAAHALSVATPGPAHARDATLLGAATPSPATPSPATPSAATPGIAAATYRPGQVAAEGVMRR